MYRDCKIIRVYRDCKIIRVYRDCKIIIVYRDCKIIRVYRDCKMKVGVGFSLKKLEVDRGPILVLSNDINLCQSLKNSYICIIWTIFNYSFYLPITPFTLKLETSVLHFKTNMSRAAKKYLWGKNQGSWRCDTFKVKAV